jgi:hypothetical protein
MKIALLILAMFPCIMFAEGLAIPDSDVAISDSISSELPAPFTAEELASPPSGEIKKKYLREVNASLTGLTTVLVSVPTGPEGQQSPLFAKLQTIKAGLDQLSSSRLESRLFGLVPTMVEVFDAEAAGAPVFVGDAVGWLQNISPAILYTVARHVTVQNASVTAGNLANFVKIFASKRGFISGGDWEDEPMPVNAAGVMVLDAAGVVTQLKAAPWQQAKQFLGGATDAAIYFARYAMTGDGLAVLKTRYSQNQAAIDAKFVELKTWVAQQEAAAQSP